MPVAYLEQRDVERLEGAAENLRDKLLIRLLGRLGCRVSEALGLTVQDIDFSQGTVRIQHLKAKVQLYCPQCGVRLGRSHVFCPSCGTRVDKAVSKAAEQRRMRMLPVDQGTLDMLREYIDRGGPVSRNGKQVIFNITRNHAWRIVKETAARAGLPPIANMESGREHNVSPHRLRDAFAVYAIQVDDSGDGLRMLQEHLGHASFNTTARYRKIGSQESREWFDRLWGKDGGQDD